MGVVLMLQYSLQLYLIAAAIFTIAHANDNEKDVYAAFKQADNGFLGAHRGNGDLVFIMILILLGLSFAARHRRTTGLTAVLFTLMLIQSSIPNPPVPALVSALHGVNALFLIGLTGYLTVITRTGIDRQVASQAGRRTGQDREAPGTLSANW